MADITRARACVCVYVPLCSGSASRMQLDRSRPEENEEESGKTKREREGERERERRGGEIVQTKSRRYIYIYARECTFHRLFALWSPRKASRSCVRPRAFITLEFRERVRELRGNTCVALREKGGIHVSRGSRACINEAVIDTSDRA